MRVVYRASFALGHTGKKLPDVEKVVETCLQWIFDRPGYLRSSAFAASTPRSVDRKDVGAGARVESLLAHDGDTDLWGARLTHPDSERDGIQWQTDLLLRIKGKNAKHFTCINRFGSAQDAVLPARRSPSRPRIVRDLLKNYGGQAGFSLGATPTPLKPSEVIQFLDMINSPERMRPIVLVTARNLDDKPIVDGNILASWLCGLAHVYVATDRFSSLNMKDLLPQRLNCWNGAARIYWPGFRSGDNPFRHRLWSPTYIREIEDTFPQGFKAHVLGYIGEAAAFAVTTDSLTWESIEAVRRRALMSELKEKGEVAELFDLAEEERRNLQAEKEHLDNEVSRLSEELKKSQNLVQSWRETCLQLQRGDNPDPDEEGLLPPVESVAEAVSRAKEQLDHFVFVLNGQSDSDSNPFEDAEQVYAALEWLATTYYQARIGQVSCPDFDVSIRGSLGWGYQSHQSKITMTKYQNWYTTKWGGRTYWLGEHIGTGSGKDSRYAIRIGFDWDRDRQKVIVGYVGQHQKTDAT